MQIARAVLVLAMILSVCRHAVNGQESRLDAAGDPLPEAALARLGTVRLRCGRHVIFSPDGKMIPPGRMGLGGQRPLPTCKSWLAGARA